MTDLAKLHQAVKEDHAKDVSLLIEKGADVNIVYQQETAFTCAVERKCFQAADIIISSRQFDPNAKNQFDRSPLFVTARVGHVDYVKRLLNMGAQVNEADVRGNTPLSACTWDDNHEVAEILIQNGANVDKEDILGQTPLHRACFSVGIKIVELLLKHNCDVNRPTNEKKTPLMAALPSYYNYQIAGKKISDMLSICEMLIKSGCNLNSQDNKGKTALHLAVESNDIHGLCLLAESGCELNVKDSLGYTPFQTAVLPRRCLYDIARYLLFYGADVKQEMQSPDGSNISPLPLVINTRPSQDELEKTWSRALLLRSMWKSVFPNKSMAKSCEYSFRSVDAVLISEQAFHEKVEREVLEWLNSCVPCSLQHQAILKVRGALGSTNIISRISLLPVGFGLKKDIGLGLRPDWMPLSKTCQLHLHIKDGRNNRVKEVIDSGIDVNVPVNNRTPLALALEVGNIEAAKMILTSCKKTHFSIVNASGDSALHIAAKYRRDELVNDIIMVFNDLDSRNYHGITPLQVAIQAGHFTTAAILIKKGTNFEVGDNQRVPLLHLAAASGATEVVKLLLDRGFDPNMEDQFRNTPLHVAASKGFEYLRHEIALPALYQDEVSASLDSVHMTLTDSMPKYTKSGTDHSSVIKYLIQYGADMMKINLHHQTPLHCAQHYKAQELLDLLNGNFKENSK